MKRIIISLFTVFIFCIMSVPTFAQSNIANDFEKITPKDTTLFFSADDFIKNSNPPQNKSLVSVKFNQVTNKNTGNLKVSGNILTKGSTVSVSDLNNLSFVPNQGVEGEAIFTWTANYGGASSPYPGAVVITIGSGESVPSVIENENKEETIKDKKEPFEEEKQENKTQNYPKVTTKSSVDHSKGLKPLRYEDMLTHWGAYSAGMLASRGYVIGEDYGSNFYFRPDEKITRLDFILMINSIFGIEPKSSLENNPFSDKNIPSYILKAAIASYEYDVIEGVKGKDGKLYLYPYDPITRAEAITIIDYALRLDSYGVGDTEFTDANQIPDWSLKSVKNLEAYGIIQGYGDGTLKPDRHITRAQAAEMVWQALKFLDLKQNTKGVFNTVIVGD